jgi:hypothetical protein
MIEIEDRGDHSCLLRSRIHRESLACHASLLQPGSKRPVLEIVSILTAPRDFRNRSTRLRRRLRPAGVGGARLMMRGAVVAILIRFAYVDPRSLPSMRTLAD